MLRQNIAKVFEYESVIVKYIIYCSWNLRHMVRASVIRSLGLDILYIHCLEIENILPKGLLHWLSSTTTDTTLCVVIQFRLTQRLYGLPYAIKGQCVWALFGHFLQSV